MFITCLFGFQDRYEWQVYSALVDGWQKIGMTERISVLAMTWLTWCTLGDDTRVYRRYRYELTVQRTQDVEGGPVTTVMTIDLIKTFERNVTFVCSDTRLIIWIIFRITLQIIKRTKIYLDDIMIYITRDTGEIVEYVKERSVRMTHTERMSCSLERKDGNLMIN